MTDQTELFAADELEELGPSDPVPPTEAGELRAHTYLTGDYVETYLGGPVRIFLLSMPDQVEDRIAHLQELVDQWKRGTHHDR